MQRDIWPSAICFLGRRCKGDTKSRNGRNLLLQDIFKGLDYLGGRTDKAREQQKGRVTELENESANPISKAIRLTKPQIHAADPLM